ncbi:MAG: PIN domain-containing protein [Gordonibacter sp.]|uniref:type II toxin-antitoxin system VapC family toxin n=1 Tax=Gordonibacter sp. TaxID=1968902 RepID=UPI002FC9874B
MKYLIDTNIIIDYFARRKQFEYAAKKLLLLGALGEFSLWVSSSQVTDIFFMLTTGPDRMSCDQAKSALRILRRQARVCSLTESDVDAALDSTWNDFEDACAYQCALRLKVDAIITRNQKDFQKSSLKVFDCDQLFAYLEEEKGLTYEEIPF